MVKIFLLNLEYDNNQCSFEIIEGNKKNSKIYISNSFCYLKKRTYKEKLYLVCHKSQHYPALAEIVGDVFWLKSAHYHQADVNFIQTTKFKNALKSQAETSTQTPRQIFDEISIQHNDIAGTIPFIECQRGIEARRRIGCPSLPKTCLNFALKWNPTHLSANILNHQLLWMEQKWLLFFSQI